MTIAELIAPLEKLAPLSYQETYDNCGLITGNTNWNCTGVLCTLDSTEAVVIEAKAKGCNLIVAHHPIIFSGLKKINGNNYVEKTIIAAIKNDIAIYAIHTNLDNIITGVNNKIADKLGIINRKILLPKQDLLSKLIVFSPKSHSEIIKETLFKAGAGNIANYSDCSFSTEGIGTFKGNKLSNPNVGIPEIRSVENEVKIEVIIPNYLKNSILSQLFVVHPYEEVAYDIFSLTNNYQQVGSGMCGELKIAIDEKEFLLLIKKQFNLKVIKHTQLLNKPIKKVAVCGGAGSFLIKKAITEKADIFITSDLKYHEFFDAENKIILVDIGHWESEQYTADLIMEFLNSKFLTFAVQKSEILTNPIEYFIN